METEANSAHLIGELLLSVALVVEADDAGARGLAPELHDVEEREVVEVAHAGADLLQVRGHQPHEELRHRGEVPAAVCAARNAASPHSNLKTP